MMVVVMGVDGGVWQPAPRRNNPKKITYAIVRVDSDARSG